MQNIRVIAFKRGRELFSSSFKDYTNSLTKSAHHFDGFIKSESYMEKEFSYKNQLIVTISDWDNEKSWNLWKNSEIRNNIYNDYKNNIIYEDFMIFVKNKDKNNTFLL